jgi:hypothetical protein
MITLVEFLNPIFLWGVIKKIAINLRNRSYYVKQMRMLNDNGTLKQMGMRLDLRSRAYYVLNLEPETLMMGQDVLDLERSRVMESINIRKVSFEKADLIELIEIETTRIKNEDYYAYLIQVKYRPSASIWNWIHVVSWISLACFVILAAVRYYPQIHSLIK